MIEELCDTYYEAINWAIAEIRVFERATLDDAERLLRRAGGQTKGVHAWLTRQLGDAPYFNGAGFGWGDLCVYPYMAGSVVNGFPPEKGTTLAAWFERVGQRESVVKCAAAAAEAFGGFQNLGAVVQSGAFVREYRDHRLEWMMRSGGASIVLDGIARKNIRFAIEVE
jgi:glutathione S-transferase/RNA polymerase-associated protein